MSLSSRLFDYESNSLVVFFLSLWREEELVLNLKLSSCTIYRSNIYYIKIANGRVSSQVVRKSNCFLEFIGGEFLLVKVKCVYVNV